MGQSIERWLIKEKRTTTISSTHLRILFLTWLSFCVSVHGCLCYTLVPSHVCVQACVLIHLCVYVISWAQLVSWQALRRARPPRRRLTSTPTKRTRRQRHRQTSWVLTGEWPTWTPRPRRLSRTNQSARWGTGERATVKWSTSRCRDGGREGNLNIRKILHSFKIVHVIFGLAFNLWQDVDD